VIRVAVVDDDLEWGDLWQRLLKDMGYSVQHFPTAGRFFDGLTRFQPHAVILDMQIPGMHGREVIRALRSNAETSALLIVAVSAHDVRSEDAVKALEAGADDYLAKPVEERLLVLRLESLLRRVGARSTDSLPVKAGELSIFPEERRVTLNGKMLDLRPLEYELLSYFVGQANRALPRSLLLKEIWKQNGAPKDERNVDKEIQNLRKKLGAYGERIQTIFKIGYLFRL
jgi:DNA-binding response OmpR family regulator